MRPTQWIVIVAATVAASCAFPVLADDVAPAAVPAATNAVKHQTLCPVTGEEINKALFVDYEGKRIYVCCGSCLGPIKKDPAKYVTKLESEGITLDKAESAKPKSNPVPTR